MGKINTVIFDIGNVLIRYDYRKYLKSQGFSAEDCEILATAVFEHPIWVERDRGGKSDPEYCQLFVDAHPHLKDKIEKLYKNILEIADVCDYAVEWISSLKDKGYHVYLLSNYSEHSFLHDKVNFPFVQLVDGAVISYEVQRVKPEAEIYQALLTKYHIVPEEAVFIDDLEKNLQVFRKFGGNTILMRSYAQAVDDLKKLGVV